MKKLLCFMLILLGSFLLFSQEAVIISNILEKDLASFLDFAYLVSNESGEDISLDESYQWCEEFNVFPKDSSPEQALTPKLFSFFMMDLYDMKGGLMWTVFHNKHYAWKEFKANRLWDVGTNPNKKMSGYDLINAINKIYSTYPNLEIKQNDENIIEEENEDNNESLGENDANN